MGEAVVRPRDVSINPTKTEVNARGYTGRIEFYGNLGEYPEYQGLSWRTWKFEDLDASKKDGALIEIKPGKRTPVEIVEADKVFSEVPLEGESVFLYLDKQGKISAYHFDSKRPRDNSFLFEVAKGEAFCWVALGQESTKVLEYEEPGFTELDLKLVNSGTKEISGKTIPDKLWIMIEQLEKGEIKNTVIPILELGDLP
jgi:hypothetical protein